MVEVADTIQAGNKKAIWGPAMLATCVTLFIQACFALIWLGAINSRIASLEKQQDALISDHVSRDDLKARDAQETLERQELTIHLNRLDDKLDRVLENQSDKTR